ncbi:uncharacterized protein NP_3494A [Natronomonas pharaonis DSM 2160]|uniref:Uncharacterized protein n=1 Tax=Natronomonas pharaonis (strain ATCC 35678 / DSM 2160 / CIP 103997 / JCM 8858 / NBRC 14720 / NCIMB 2260 / Gabara) TaxID=348780 RepID=A0A1U7EXD5_NATPD|nr:hypothetical protein [Natronomonas pharaonis]CAI49838.1 uncharacterized protein NP_3494A [Natronomonas pharaonis DSM 2160]
MQRDYRYTVYVLALAALVTLATAGLTVAGSASTSDPADASLAETDFEIVDHDDTLTDEETDEISDLVRETEPLQEHFDGVDALQLDIHQSKALDDGAFVPIEGEYTVKLSPPSDDRPLPSASLSVNVDESALVIDRTIAPIDDVNVTVEDDGHLSDDEIDQLTGALPDDGDVAYQIQTFLGEPDTVEMAVTDRDGDEVDADVTVDGASDTVHVTVDIDEETVLSNHVAMQLDSDELDEEDDLTLNVDMSADTDTDGAADESDETDAEAENVDTDEREEITVEIVDDDGLEDAGDEFTFTVVTEDDGDE